MSDELRQRLRSLLRDSIPKVVDDSVVNRIVRTLASYWPEAVLPSVNETAAVAIANPKTAALCFDRVWGIDGGMPDSIRFGGATQYELEVVARLVLMAVYAESAEAMPDAKRKLDEMSRELSVFYGLSKTGNLEAIDCFSRALSDHFEAEVGLSTVPVFDSIAKKNDQFKAGDHSSIVATLSQLKVVSEKELSWEQVLEFRMDGEARSKYRRLMHWLDKEMVTKPLGYIQDEIAEKLEDYDWALKKHGVKTVVGVVSRILKTKTFLPGSVASAGLLLTGDTGLGMLTGGIMVAKVAVEVAEVLLDRQALARSTNPEVAFVHEVRSRLGKKGRQRSQA